MGDVAGSKATSWQGRGQLGDTGASEAPAHLALQAKKAERAEATAPCCGGISPSPAPITSHQRQLLHGSSRQGLCPSYPTRTEAGAQFPALGATQAHGLLLLLDSKLKANQ